MRASEFVGRLHQRNRIARHAPDRFGCSRNHPEAALLVEQYIAHFNRAMASDRVVQMCTRDVNVVGQHCALRARERDLRGAVEQHLRRTRARFKQFGECCHVRYSLWFCNLFSVIVRS